METRKEVKQVQVDYQCPKCKKGYLRPTGMALTTYPPQFPHKCNNCDYMETFRDKQYPYIDYEEIDNKKVKYRDDIATVKTTALFSCATGEYVCQTNIVNTPSNNGNNF